MKWRSILCGVFALLILGGCKTREIMVTSTDTIIRTEIKTDTLRLFSVRSDTVFEKDSIVVFVDTAGVTTAKYIYRDRYKTKLVYDTIYKSVNITDKERETKQETTKKIVKSKNIFNKVVFGILTLAVIVFIIVKIFFRK